MDPPQQKCKSTNKYITRKVMTSITLVAPVSLLQAADVHRQGRRRLNHPHPVSPLLSTNALRTE